MPVCPNIENSQLISTAIQSTGFYMRAALAFNGLSSHIYQKIVIMFHAIVCHFLVNVTVREGLE